MATVGNVTSKPNINGEITSKQSLNGNVSIPDLIHGKSAYEIALLHGFEGTEEEWLASLKADNIIESAQSLLTLHPNVTRYYFISGAAVNITCEDFSAFPLGYTATIVFYHYYKVTGLDESAIATDIFKDVSDNGMPLADFKVGCGTDGVAIIIYKSDDSGKFNWFITKNSVINTSGGTGVTTEQVNTLWELIKISTFTENPTTAIANFKKAWNIDGEEVEPDTPVEPEVTLVSISATYTGGDVAVGTALTALTGITVVATYSDGTTKNVSGYTLSGTIQEGNNTITVAFGGKTTTFTVVGVAEEEPTPSEWVYDEANWVDDDKYITPSGAITDYTASSYMYYGIPVVEGNVITLSTKPLNAATLVRAKDSNKDGLLPIVGSINSAGDYTATITIKSGCSSIDICSYMTASATASKPTISIS